MAEFFQNCWGYQIAIKSGPVALCGFKLASNFWMPGVDIVMFGIDGWGLGPLSGRGSGVSFVKLRRTDH